MKTIHLARGLTLPAAELATKVTGAFGIRGSGKSNLMSVVIEQLLDAGIQVIVLDPVGIHFSLRLAPNGKTASPYKLAVLGGRHGDIPLQSTAGEVVGRALARSNDSCVLDISSMKKGERIRFSGAFFEAFYEGKKENPSPVLLCLEEAQRFAPQLMFKGSGQEQMLGAVEELAEQGRNFGAGLWLNSLRPQKVNKDVTSLMDLVFGFRLTGVHERKAVKEWLQEKGAEGRDEIDGELPSLQAGHAFVWSPAVFNIFGKYHIVSKKTYDAGATPLYARAKVKMRQLDIGVLEEQMRHLVEEAKMNDPRTLKARIAELERAATLIPTQKVGKPKTVEVSVFREADLKRIEKLADRMAKHEDVFTEQFDAAAKRFGDIVSTATHALSERQKGVQEAIGKLAMTVVQGRGGSFVRSGRLSSTTVNMSNVPKPIRGENPGRREVDHGNGITRVTALRPNTTAEADDLPKYALDLLNVLAQRGKASDSQISTLSGYRRTSSAFGINMGKLAKAGLVVGSSRERVITEVGRARAGAVEPLPTGRALLDYWLAKLTGYEALFLKNIYEAKTISREELSEKTKRSMSSSAFGLTISALQRLSLIEAPRGGDLTIAESFG